MTEENAHFIRPVVEVQFGMVNAEEAAPMNNPLPLGERVFREYQEQNNVPDGWVLVTREVAYFPWREV